MMFSRKIDQQVETYYKVLIKTENEKNSAEQSIHQANFSVRKSIFIFVIFSFSHKLTFLCFEIALSNLFIR